MEILEKKISIPLALHELHGKQSTILDLLLTYTIAVFSVIVALYLASHSFDEIHKFIVLGILVFDLSGGVVSNFTEGTATYYHDKPKARFIFIALHVIQPLVLIWLFTDNIIGIAVVSTYALIATVIINHTKEHPKQRVHGAFLTVVGLTISFLVGEMQPVVHLMLMLLVVKLVMAFAIRWK